MGSVISGASIAAVGALILVLGVLSALRRLPLNAVAGLRFPSTMASPGARSRRPSGDPSDLGLTSAFR